MVVLSKEIQTFNILSNKIINIYLICLDIIIDVIKEHVITPEERTNLESMGVIEKLPERKKREPKKKDEKVDNNKKTKTKTPTRSKK